MCSDLLISLLACSSGKLKLVAVLVLVLFTVVFFTCYNLTSYSIVLPVTISALVFRLWSICFRCIIYEGYLGCFIGMKVYRVRTSFDLAS